MARASRWQVLTATAIGSAHETGGRPIQDAVATLADPAGSTLVVAVADGHGHARHPRSGQGSQFAVAAACAAGLEHAPRLAEAVTAQEARAVAQAALVPDLIGRWREQVAADLAAAPLNPGEAGWLRPGEDGAVAYGTTLLLAVVAHPWLTLCQIGDGDIVVGGADGTATTPVPGDDRLDGRRTTSMCQLDALDSFRCAALDLTGSPVAAVLLATDGFGNAQSAEPWQQTVGADLVSFARRHGSAWLQGQLPLWAARCASAEGSGDDTTLALLLAEDAGQPPEPSGHAGPAQAVPGEADPEQAAPGVRI